MAEMLTYKRHKELAEGAPSTAEEARLLAKLALAYLDYAAVSGTTEDHEDMDNMHMDLASFYDENQALFAGNEEHERKQAYEVYQKDLREWHRVRKAYEDHLFETMPRPAVQVRITEWEGKNPKPVYRQP